MTATTTDTAPALRLSALGRFMHDRPGPADIAQRAANNLLPAIGGILAEQWGVPYQVLVEWGIGYLPAVHWATSVDTRGYFTIPERDSSGLIRGVSLRSLDGSDKRTYPGTKRALALSPSSTERQSAHFRPGPHNWVRTEHAGVDCVVCGKGEGCLVHRDDPEDPQAVVCARVEEGATKALETGWLHVRRALQKDESPQYTVVVEGASDAVVAYHLGFNAIGRPSATAGKKDLAAAAKGRNVIVVGENDRKGDLWPGRDGAVAAMRIVRRVAASARLVFPPEGVKDLREWYARHGLTAEQLVEAAQGSAERLEEQMVLPDGSPSTVAKAYLDEEHKYDGAYTLVNAGGQWYGYGDMQWEPLSRERLRGPVYDWARGKSYAEDGEKVKPLNLTRNKIGDVLDAMVAPSLAFVPDSPPFWIGENRMGDANPHNWMPFVNGILHVPSYLAGHEDCMIPHTPRYVSTYTLPYGWDSGAEAPRFEEAILGTTIGDDEKVRLYLAWLGYCMTCENRHQKMLVMQGRRGTGKSAAAEILQMVVGEGNTSSPSLGSLGSRFGLSPLVGATNAIISDVRVGGEAGKTQAVENLLKLTGGDRVDVDIKYREPLRNQKLLARTTMVCNYPPPLPDPAGALLRRIMVMKFTHAFSDETRDVNLLEKIQPELPGIAAMSLRAYRDVADTGLWPQPHDSEETLRQWRLTTSPVAEFVEDCMQCGADASCEVSVAMRTWRRWARENGARTLPRELFLDHLVTADSRIHVEGTTILGARLTPSARTEYGGRA